MCTGEFKIEMVERAKNEDVVVPLYLTNLQMRKEIHYTCEVIACRGGR